MISRTERDRLLKHEGELEEYVCNLCDGTGLYCKKNNTKVQPGYIQYGCPYKVLPRKFPDDDYETCEEFDCKCPKCNGEGKVDWIRNTMS